MHLNQILIHPNVPGALAAQNLGQFALVPVSTPSRASPASTVHHERVLIAPINSCPQAQPDAPPPPPLQFTIRIPAWVYLLAVLAVVTISAPMFLCEAIAYVRLDFGATPDDTCQDVEEVEAISVVCLAVLAAVAFVFTIVVPLLRHAGLW